MPLTFNPAEIPTESEEVMLANLPPAGHLYYFFNTDKDGNVYSIDSNGNIVFVASIDDNCCTCCLSEAWLKGLNNALSIGAITAPQFQTAISTGFVATSSKDAQGNCSVSVGTNFATITSLVMNGKVSHLSDDDSVQLSVTILPLGADPRVLWVSSNPTIATVDQTGLVVAQGPHGSVTISVYSVSDNTKYDSVTIAIP